MFRGRFELVVCCCRVYCCRAHNLLGLWGLSGAILIQVMISGHSVMVKCYEKSAPSSVSRA
jgi:hypothetical protein